VIWALSPLSVTRFTALLLAESLPQKKKLHKGMQFLKEIKESEKKEDAGRARQNFLRTMMTFYVRLV
jgi:hypothetical protein